jgi:hypothetical protein
METHSEHTDLGRMNIFGNREMAFRGRSFALEMRRYKPIVPITKLGTHMPMMGGQTPVSPRTNPTDINT